jgi:hypothetical protein
LSFILTQTLELHSRGFSRVERCAAHPALSTAVDHGETKGGWVRAVTI